MLRLAIVIAVCGTGLTGSFSAARAEAAKGKQASSQQVRAASDQRKRCFQATALSGAGT